MIIILPTGHCSSASHHRIIYNFYYYSLSQQYYTVQLMSCKWHPITHLIIVNMIYYTTECMRSTVK